MAKNVMLIDFLFGSVQALIEAVDSVATMPKAARQDGEHQKRSVVGRTVVHLEASKQKLLAFRHQHPDANRTAILRALGRVATDLRDHALEWYEQNMPAAVRPSGRKRTFTEGFLLEEAESLRVHIISRYTDEMRGRQRPRRITERFLLLGHSLQARAREVRALVPEINELLDRLIEDKLPFRHRQARWFLNYPRRLPAGTDRIEFIARSVGLTVSEVLRIAEFPWYQRADDADDEES
ncbi:hypothetical protein [Cupriavidus necator]